MSDFRQAKRSHPKQVDRLTLRKAAPVTVATSAIHRALDMGKSPFSSWLPGSFRSRLASESSWFVCTETVLVLWFPSESARPCCDLDVVSLSAIRGSEPIVRYVFTSQGSWHRQDTPFVRTSRAIQAGELLLFKRCQVNGHNLVHVDPGACQRTDNQLQSDPYGVTEAPFSGVFKQVRVVCGCRRWAQI